MDLFVTRSNVARFEDLLARETDPEGRKLIQDLLSFERRSSALAQRIADEAPLPGVLSQTT